MASKTFTLRGHIVGQAGTFKIPIDPTQDIDDLVDLIKEKKKNHPQIAAADKLDIYKLDDPNEHAEYVKVIDAKGEPVDVKIEKGVKDETDKNAPTYEYYKNNGVTTETPLKGSEELRAYWGPLGDIAGRVHFFVVPDNQAPQKPNLDIYINTLTLELRDWCKPSENDIRSEVEEDLLGLGDQFPLQQCETIIQRLRRHMLDSFKHKYRENDKQWLKTLSVPIVGAASGTGKTAICSRFLDEVAKRAKVNSPPTSVTLAQPSNLAAPIDRNYIEQIVADAEGHLPPQGELDLLPLHSFWTEERLKDFREKAIRSAGRKLSLTIDLMPTAFQSNESTLEAKLAASLLIAYSKRDATKQTWRLEEAFSTELSAYPYPFSLALRVLRNLEGDNIIVIHLDETQTVSTGTLQALVTIIVRHMDYAHRDEVPWIFPILSGLSLESLMDSSKTSGAQIERYTPPVLSITSMLNIIKAMFYPKKEPPTFQKGLIRLLHDVRGPTRYFQALLLIIQNNSGKDDTYPWSLTTPIDRNRIRAGLEDTEQNWGGIFDRLAQLVQQGILCKDLAVFHTNHALVRRLFDLNLLGETVNVKEQFIINGKLEPLSTIFDYGWATIVETTGLNNCAVFLPFLTLYKPTPDDPYSEDHPGLTPLCKPMNWRIVEREDARMLQYRLTRRSMRQLFDTRLSDLFGDLGDVLDVQFQLSEEPHEFKDLQQRKVEAYQELFKLVSIEKQPTVYLNGDKAKFADSFVLLPQRDAKPHVLCIQSKFLQRSELTYTELEKEYNKVSDVCRDFTFTLVIPADQIASKCRASISHNDSLKFHVLLLDSSGFDAFYGKPLAFRRQIFSGMSELPEIEAQATQEDAVPQGSRPEETTRSGKKRMGEGKRAATRQKRGRQ